MKYFKRILISLAFIFLLLPNIERNIVYADYHNLEFSGSRSYLFNPAGCDVCTAGVNVHTHVGWGMGAPAATAKVYLKDEDGNTLASASKSYSHPGFNGSNWHVSWTDNITVTVPKSVRESSDMLCYLEVVGDSTSYSSDGHTVSNSVSSNSTGTYHRIYETPIFSSGNLTPVKFRINIILFNTISCVFIRFDC